jgi:hypothetical protein
MVFDKVKASTEHRCELCNDTIPVGSTYFRYTYRAGPTYRQFHVSTKFHEECMVEVHARGLNKPNLLPVNYTRIRFRPPVKTEWFTDTVPTQPGRYEVKSIMFLYPKAFYLGYATWDGEMWVTEGGIVVKAWRGLIREYTIEDFRS